ncbi:MAG: YraN family protein [Anaerolineae bacterium]|jgi:putative endonuclease|nr:YraN family protein [Anaerolineae bacterium]
MAKGKVGLGRRGEALAVPPLLARGFTIVAQNWFCDVGEADLIATRGGEWYFIEVRTRRGGVVGAPEESITARKRSRMVQVAQRYLSEHLPDADPAWHLGLIAVGLDHSGHLMRMTLYLDLEGEPEELLDGRA